MSDSLVFSVSFCAFFNSIRAGVGLIYWTKCHRCYCVTRNRFNKPHHIDNWAEWIIVWLTKNGRYTTYISLYFTEIKCSRCAEFDPPHRTWWSSLWSSLTLMNHSMKWKLIRTKWANDCDLADQKRTNAVKKREREYHIEIEWLAFGCLSWMDSFEWCIFAYFLQFVVAVEWPFLSVAHFRIADLSWCSSPLCDSHLIYTDTFDRS